MALQVANMLCIFVTDPVLGKETNCKELQPENMFCIVVTDPVLGNDTDCKELQPANMPDISTDAPVSGKDTCCKEKQFKNMFPMPVIENVPINEKLCRAEWEIFVVPAAKTKEVILVPCAEISTIWEDVDADVKVA
jgi:hypothetical protein